MIMGLEDEFVVCRNDDVTEEDEELGLAPDPAQAQQQQLQLQLQQQLQRFARGVVGSPLQSRKVVVVGYALTSKKTESFLQPKLKGLAW